MRSFSWVLRNVGIRVMLGFVRVAMVVKVWVEVVKSNVRIVVVAVVKWIGLFFELFCLLFIFS